MAAHRLLSRRRLVRIVKQAPCRLIAPLLSARASGPLPPLHNPVHQCGCKHDDETHVNQEPHCVLLLPPKENAASGETVPGQSGPSTKHVLGIGGFDLLGIPPVIDAKQRVMALIGGTANRVADDDDAIA